MSLMDEDENVIRYSADNTLTHSRFYAADILGPKRNFDVECAADSCLPWGPSALASRSSITDVVLAEAEVSTRG
jgi:hypothetical protein